VSFGLSTAQAQITLTANNNLQVGDEFTFYRGTSAQLDEGADGANMVWDFSTVQLPDLIEIIVKDASTVDLLGEFPDANLALDEQPGNTYMSMDNDRQAWYGAGSDFGAVVVYSDPQDLVRYPMTLGDSFTDNFTGTIANFIRSGVSTVTCDAYGTLITPTGTFDNVVRLKTIMDYGDFSNGVQIAEYHEERFWWFNEATGFPIFNVNRLTAAGSTVYSASYSVDGVSAISDVESIDRFSVFPNPADSQLAVELNLLKRTDLKIQLLNVLGQVVRETIEPTASGLVNTIFETGAMPNGWYVLNVLDGQRSIATYKVQVQH